MMKLKYFFLSISIFCSICALAQSNVKRPDSYNYNRGLEELRNENNEEALNYFNKELQDNPKNGYAYCLMAETYKDIEEYGQAFKKSWFQ